MQAEGMDDDYECCKGEEVDVILEVIVSSVAVLFGVVDAFIPTLRGRGRGRGQGTLPRVRESTGRIDVDSEESKGKEVMRYKEKV